MSAIELAWWIEHAIKAVLDVGATALGLYLGWILSNRLFGKLFD